MNKFLTKEKEGRWRREECGRRKRKTKVGICHHLTNPVL